MVSLASALGERQGVKRLLQRIESNEVNVGKAERLASTLAGGALVWLGLKRRGLLGGALVPLGAVLLHRGATGRSVVYGRLGMSTAPTTSSPVASIAQGQGVKAERSVTINRPVEEVFQYWRNFENLPRFMAHLKEVRRIDGKRSHWIAKAPAGGTVEWDGVIHNEIPNRLIAWRSLENADVNNAGSVHFTPTANGRGTEVRVILSCEPPAGSVGIALAKLFGEEPSQQVEEDLRRFKQIMEAGEISSTAE